MPVHFVVETAKLNDVLMELMEWQQKLFVVLDAYGGLSGIISMEDTLEEVLGLEMIDESGQGMDKRKLAKERRNRIISR